MSRGTTRGAVYTCEAWQTRGNATEGLERKNTVLFCGCVGGDKVRIEHLRCGEKVREARGDERQLCNTRERLESDFTTKWMESPLGEIAKHHII